jgi:hypothetical protein
VRFLAVFLFLLHSRSQHSPGTVLQFRKDDGGAVGDEAPGAGEDSDRGEWSDEDGSQDDEGPRPRTAPSTSADLWFAKFLYAFRREGSDQVQLHVQWCAFSLPRFLFSSFPPYRSSRFLFRRLTASTAIRSLGKLEVEPRQLFLLDSCASLPVESLLSIVDKDDFSFLTPKQTVPRDGYYCWAQYSEDDGTFVDIPSSSSSAACAAANVEPCPSCESSAVHSQRTRENADGKPVLVARPATARDGLFSLAGS